MTRVMTTSFLAGAVQHGSLRLKPLELNDSGACISPESASWPSDTVQGALIASDLDV